MNILVQLGMRIRYLRKAKHMSQLDLSLEAGVNKNYISDLEKGRRNPSLLVLEKIAKGLGEDLSSLLKGIESFK
ncbi:MAG: helix-turn-helix domain-containing protein [Bacilli bacterium]|nr:helix-turn-helix domain-containing protein [Bacilli bacterium]